MKLVTYMLFLFFWGGGGSPSACKLSRPIQYGICPFTSLALRMLLRYKMDVIENEGSDSLRTKLVCKIVISVPRNIC